MISPRRPLLSIRATVVLGGAVIAAGIMGTAFWMVHPMAGLCSAATSFVAAARFLNDIIE